MQRRSCRLLSRVCDDGYKTAKQVIQRLIDTVSKNGTLLLSIPVRGNGEIDDKEEKVLTDMAGWMEVNAEAIFETRPWDIYGEGPTRFAEGYQSEDVATGLSHEDIRFTTRRACSTPWRRNGPTRRT